MPFDPSDLARIGSWIATGLGVGLWGWSWIVEKNAIQKIRLMDCGIVLVFSATLVRIVAQDRAMTPIDWGLTFLSPLFIAGALWRLARTACPYDGDRS